MSTHKGFRSQWCFHMVETSGLEPPTPCMSSRYSDQLSYASKNDITEVYYSFQLFRKLVLLFNNSTTFHWGGGAVPFLLLQYGSGRFLSCA